MPARSAKLKSAEGGAVAVTKTFTENDFVSQDYDEFKAAFQKLENGQIFVDIPEMRKELGWDREKFDLAMSVFRREGTFAMYTADPTTRTPEEIKDGWTDKNGFAMGTITLQEDINPWRGRNSRRR
jgi:hypothetical protein